MEKRFAKLERIDNNETITKETHYDFLYHLQKAILLALREQGRLNAMQYRHTEDSLNQQRLDRAKTILEKEKAHDESG